jgi:hypothetical protein
MREAELFAAYRQSSEDPDISRMRLEERWLRRGFTICHWPKGCDTLIGLWANRFMCRYHTRKIRETQKL